MAGELSPEEDTISSALYSAATSQWIHAEQMRWTILYNFLVGNTILLVAWSTLFAALLTNARSLSLRIVMIGSCLLGLLGASVWTLLEMRANRFSERYFNAGLELERAIRRAPSIVGPFETTHQHRGTGGLVKTHVVVVAVPLVFAAVYFGLLLISIYAAAGRA